MSIKINHMGFRLIPAVLWAGLILVVSATPEPVSVVFGDTSRTVTPLTVFGVDLVSLLDYPYHFLVYFILALLAARALLPKKPFEFKRCMLVWVLVMGIALVDEVQQLYVPTRDFEVIDLVMDGLGAAVGLFAYAKWHHAQEEEMTGDRGQETG